MAGLQPEICESHDADKTWSLQILEPLAEILRYIVSCEDMAEIWISEDSWDVIP